MASKTEKQVWETFVRRPGDLKEGDEISMALRDLTPGRKKYRMRHVVATLRRDAREGMDLLRVRTVVGVQLPETWGVRILRDLPIEIQGKPYRDFYQALKAAAAKNS
ncbi:MAG: phenylphosphate carboxylase subunit gamma [Alphaproteobacteria bacterium]